MSETKTEQLGTMHTPVPIGMCETHSRRNWMKHDGYYAEVDGTVKCRYCDWGSKLPGYMKVKDGKIVDLRS